MLWKVVGKAVRISFGTLYGSGITMGNHFKIVVEDFLQRRFVRSLY